MAYIYLFKKHQYDNYQIKVILYITIGIQMLISSLGCYPKFYFCKNLPTQYAIYDELIESYARYGNKINTQYMKNILQNSNPKISRQQNYLPKLKNIFKQSAPHFKQNLKYYKDHNMFSKILILYQSLNLHRKQIFDITQQSYPNLKNIKSLTSLINIYRAMIQLHHQGDPNFKRKLKVFIVEGIFGESFLVKQEIEKCFDTSLKVFKYLLMDAELDLQQASRLLNFIQTKIIPKLANVSLINKNLGQTLAFLKELMKLHGIQVKDQKFRKILQTAMKFQVSQKVQETRKIVKKQNYSISFGQEDIEKTSGKIEVQNDRRMNYGQSSVFQTIFARQLQDIGYDFQRNIFLGMFQYDLLVKGKKFKKYIPFKNMNLSKNTEFSPKVLSTEEWDNFKEMKGLSKLQSYQQFQKPIILNLNGPYHYIDSDVYGMQRVSRTEQIKGKILKNYGYTHFNTVHYQKWQVVHEKSVFVQAYIDQLLSKNLLQKI